MKVKEFASHPNIVRYAENNPAGIHLLQLSRCAVGYVIKGARHIYYGDERYTINQGDIYYMGAGNHYVEEVAEDGKAFEQIVCYYTPEQLQRILLNLNMGFSINITNSHQCEKCRRLNHTTQPASNIIRSFFAHTMIYLQHESTVHDAAAENIKMTELIYLIVTQDKACLKNKVLNNVDTARDNFEQIIYSHIFTDISIEKLAEKCNRSLTSFKKEFRRHFFMPPHRWFIKQRLMQSRLLLISTSKSISEIGIECTFPNTSHFIKLFKKQYGSTPAIYRSEHRNTLIDNEYNTTPASIENDEENTPIESIAL